MQKVNISLEFIFTKHLKNFIRTWVKVKQVESIRLESIRGSHRRCSTQRGVLNNFTKCLRTAFLWNTSWLLLLIDYLFLFSLTDDIFCSHRNFSYEQLNCLPLLKNRIERRFCHRIRGVNVHGFAMLLPWLFHKFCFPRNKIITCLHYETINIDKNTYQTWLAI